MEWCKSNCGQYRIECLTAITFPAALEVIRVGFCQDEPVSIGSEVNKSPEAADELLELCADAALDGVSLVAVEISTGKVAAVAFNKLQVPSSGSSERTFFEIFAEERCKNDSSKSLIQFMANVDERCNLFEKYGVDCSLEIMFLATSRDHRQKRLASLLCQTTLELGKRLQNGPVAKITVQDLGPKYSHMKPREVPQSTPKICQAIWTPATTQRIGRSLGFTSHIQVSYEEFVFNGKTYAERIGPESLYCELSSKMI